MGASMASGGYVTSNATSLLQAGMEASHKGDEMIVVANGMTALGLQFNSPAARNMGKSLVERGDRIKTDGEFKTGLACAEFGIAAAFGVLAIVCARRIKRALSPKKPAAPQA
jgi:hypothetical protein